MGSTIGSIYAWAAVGGVVGILLTGFFFIGAFGSAALIWLMGTALLMAAVLYWVSCWALYLWAMVFLALATMGMAGEKWAQDAGTAARLRERPDPNVVYEAETPYGLVAVMLRRERPDQRAFVQDHLPRSEMAVNDATCLISFHQKVYAALTRGLSENRGDLLNFVGNTCALADQATQVKTLRAGIFLGQDQGMDLLRTQRPGRESQAGGAINTSADTHHEPFAPEIRRGAGQESCDALDFLGEIQLQDMLVKHEGMVSEAR